jgi:hypothetical protein
VSGAVLNDTVALPKVHLFRVELEPDLPRQHANEIDAGRAMHSVLVRFHVGGSSGKLLFEFSLVLDREPSRSLGVLRGDGVDVVAKATGWWKVCQWTFAFRPRRVARWIIETPETVPCIAGKRRDRDGLNKIVSNDARPAVDRAGDDATHRSRAHEPILFRGLADRYRTDELHRRLERMRERLAELAAEAVA